MSVTIEQDLKEYLAQQFKQIELRFQQIDQRFEQIDKRFEQVDKRFEKIEARLEKIEGDITDLKVGQARLEEKMDALDKRLEFQEFINRGILIGFLAAILAGLAKLFGVIPGAVN
ncbi:MAG: hypothetical protein NZ901_12740 [Geminocystis sp.]|nr:hypothetical protein [Geminocystis sp.]MCS7149035.1 hypothetical protein [Geminocystis sp.]MDW8462185.1 hypothetical protein [Geminocystis sp.]